MTDRYRQALEGLRERCAQVAERITSRRRMITALMNNEVVKPCEVAAAIRKIDVQQHYECAVREIEALQAEVDALRKALSRILENGAPDWKFAEELREEARAVLFGGSDNDRRG